MTNDLNHGPKDRFWFLSKLGLGIRCSSQTESLEGQESEQELRRQLRALSALTAVSLLLNSTLDLEEVLSIIVSAVIQVIGCQKSAVYDLALSGDTLSLRVGHGLGPGFIQAAQHLAINSDLAQIVTTGQVIAVSDVMAEPDFDEWVELAAAEGFRAFANIPLVVEDKVAGCLAVYFTDPRLLTEFELELLNIFANQAAVAIKNARQYDAVLQKQNLIKTILTCMVEGVVVTDTQSSVVMANQAASEMLGIEPGQKWSAQPSSSKLANRGKALLAARGSQLMNDQWQAILEKDGRLLSVSSTALPDDSGIGSVYVIRDITHWVELDQIKSDFINQVSHELRTPLTTIKMLVDLLKTGGRYDDKEREYLDIIEVEVDRQSQLVNDLLEIGYLETGEINWTMVEVSPTDVADQAMRASLPLAKQKGITLIGQPLPSLPRVMGTPRRLQEVLVNLLINAIKYTPPGGRVAVEAGSNDEIVWIAVRDTGPGIPDDDLPHLFDKFYRARQTSQDRQGVGLGLAIALQIVESFKGTIDVTSQIGQGSCFTVRLPRARAFVAALRENMRKAEDECANSFDR